jgi:phage shock protein C
MAKSNKTLQLDRENRKLLGVCAGLANYLSVEAWVVRLVYLGCIFFGALFLIPMYFIAWFLLDDSSQSVRDAVSENHTVRHFKNLDYRKKLFKNPQTGKFLGVCAGIADYLEVSVFAVRIIFLALTFFTGFPLLFYFAAAMVLDKRPADEPGYTEYTAATSRRPNAAETPEAPAAGTRDGTGKEAPAGHRTVYGSFQEEQFSKRREFSYCARRFATLQTRLARIEAYVTSKHFKLHREFRSLG